MSDLTIRVDFIVLNTIDPKMIGVADTSQNWGTAETEPAWIYITPPGAKNPIIISFIKKNIMFFNSENLGFTCVEQCVDKPTHLIDLPDGVWEFCLKSKFIGFEKKRLFLKDDSLRLMIDKIRVNKGIDYDPNSCVIKGLDEVEFLLEGAHAEIRRGNEVMAMKAYNRAVKIAEEFLKCKDCV